MMIKRIKRVDKKGFVNADCSDIFPAIRHPLFLEMIGENKFFVLFDQVELFRIHGNMATHIVPSVTSTAEGMGFPLDSDPRNLAFPVAFIFSAVANERFPLLNGPFFPNLERKGFFLEYPQLKSALPLESDAESADQSRLRRNNDAFSRKRSHSHRHGQIIADASLYEDFISHRPVPLHAVVIVHTDGIDQAG